MSALRSALADYLALRRSLGFTLDRTERLLAQFVTYCEATAAEAVTVDLAMSWATLPDDADPSWYAHRLSVVRGFAKHLAFIDERTEVPAADLLPYRKRRATPYLYSHQEVARLMAAAAQFPSPLRQATLSALVGLLYVTGMRVGEAIRLDRDDVDLTDRLLVVRDSKFGNYAEDVIMPSEPSGVLSLLGTHLRLSA